MTALQGSVFVTGANRGVGLALIKHLLKQPVPPKHLFATCRSLKGDGSKEITELTGKHPNLHLLEFDVTATSRLPEIVEKVSKVVGELGLNVLVNNAGVFYKKSLETVDVEMMMKSFEVNTIAPLMISKHFLPLLRQAATKKNNSSPSVIVNISTLMGSIDDNTSGRFYAYRSSKAALNMVTKSLSIDLARDGILTVAFHPGWVQTEMGGSGAKITAEESVDGLLKVVSSLNKSSSGSFINYAGKIMPW